MSKMKEVAKILGVEIGEEFSVTKSGYTYRLTESGMETISMGGISLGGKRIETSGYMLCELLAGRKTIIKKPWRPKYGEQYWCATTYCGASFCEWQDRMSDLAYYAVGNCFRTKEEAEAHEEEVLARLEKIYDDGKPLIGKVVFEEDITEKKEDGLHSIIRCRQCKYYHEAHYEAPGDSPYIKHQCKNKYGLNKYTVRPDEDYCSRAEKQEG